MKKNYVLPAFKALSMVPTKTHEWCVLETIVATGDEAVEIEAVFIGTYDEAMAEFVKLSHEMFKNIGGGFIDYMPPGGSLQ